MKNIKKYIIGFIIGLLFIGSIAYSSGSGTIGNLFEKIGNDWVLLGKNIKDETISKDKLTIDLQNEINANTVKVGMTTNQINTIANNTTNIGNLSVNLVGVSNNVSSLSLNSNQNTSDIANLSGQIWTLSGEVYNVSNKFGTLTEGKECRSINGKIECTFNWSIIPTPWSCGDNIEYDGFSYGTKVLPDGNCWTTKNMAHKTTIGNDWCYNDLANCSEYGRIYNWDAANSICGQLGVGWNLPSKIDWDLLKSLGATGWTGNKVFGMISNLPGYRHRGNFVDIDKYGNWWSSTALDLSNSYYFLLGFNNNRIVFNTLINSMGNSVVCIKK